MGYTNLKDCGGSDGSADMVYQHIDSLHKLVKRNLRDKGNWINTSGAVNIALFAETFMLPIAKPLAKAFMMNDEFTTYLCIVRDKLEDEVASTSAAAAPFQSSLWSNEENRLMHRNAYKRMLKNMNKLINIFMDSNGAKKIVLTTEQRDELDKNEKKYKAKKKK